MIILLAVVLGSIGVFLVVFLVIAAKYRGARQKLRALHEWGAANGWEVASNPHSTGDLPDAFITSVLRSKNPVKVKVNSVLTRREGDQDELAFNVTGLVWGSYAGRSSQRERRLGAVALATDQVLPELTLVEPALDAWLLDSPKAEQAAAARPRVDLFDFYRVAPDEIDRLPSPFTPETADLLLVSPFSLHIERPWVVAVFRGHLTPEDVGRGLELIRSLLATTQSEAT